MTIDIDNIPEEGSVWFSSTGWPFVVRRVKIVVEYENMPDPHGKFSVHRSRGVLHRFLEEFTPAP